MVAESIVISCHTKVGICVEYVQLFVLKFSSVDSCGKYADFVPHKGGHLCSRCSVVCAEIWFF